MSVDHISRLELDVDTRLAELWRLADDVDEWTLQWAARFMRSAYAQGYNDALGEAPGERGRLFRENGYAVPRRRA